MNKKLIKEIQRIANLYKINIIKDENGEFTKEFIEKFQDNLNWHNISYSQELNENFIRKFQDKIYWNIICHKQKLSENFIREFQDKFKDEDWEKICCKQKLSEEFIRDFKNKVWWDYIYWK
jgi:hypothetical protein